MVPCNPPLRQHVLFESCDPDEARAHVGRVFCPHGLAVTRSPRGLAARQHFVQLGRASLSYLAYGAAVMIDPEVFRSFYLVQLPLWGTAHIRIGRQELASSPTLASIVNPSDPLHMEWTADCGQLIVRFERSFVESLLAHHLGHTLRHALTFHCALDCGTERNRRWLQLLECVVRQIEAAPDKAFGPLATRQLEQALLALLLEAQPHDYSEELRLPGGGCVPRHVRKAMEFIEANVSEPIGIEEIVCASGASMRSLYAGFRRFRSTSPMEFLRTQRLKRVRDDLREAAAGSTVSDIAARWGFYQFGRFAAQYRDLFGESPSATLRRASASRED
jgi:AraC-like DNA-binding protein